MIQKVQGEQPFQVLATNFSIGPSNEGYTLQISADGNNYTNLFSVDANTTRMVTAVANGSFYRMLGNNSEVAVNWRTQCNDGGTGGGSGSGGTDTGTVQTMINQSLSNYTANLEEGEPIVGMAKQLYSPDGVTSEGAFTYRTTGGDKDVSTGKAELRKIEGNSIYPELQYNDSAALERSGEPVTGFTYDIEWGSTEGWYPVAGNSSFSTKKARIKLAGYGNFYPGFWYDNGSDCQWHWDGSSLSSWGVNVIDRGDGNWDTPYGTAYFDGTYLTVYVSDSYPERYMVSISDQNAGAGADIWDGTTIPNDIPAGESTYIFTIDENNVLGSWTPSLPQALQNMQVDGSDYVPQDGDEITINRSLYKEGRAQFSNPRTFVSVELNSFNKDADTPISAIIGEGWYAVKGVTGLENGYTIYDENSGITAVGLNSTPDSTGAELLDNVDGALNYITPTTAKPWIVFQVSNTDKVCVHPRWSGYNDLVYEPYEESKIEGLLSFVNNCPMWSVGNVHNIIDIEGGQLINNIGSEEYSAARVNELLASGYTLGVDFDFDSALIYKVLDNPVVAPITFDGEYKANDFGVEYFLDANGIISTPVYAETYYMQNLVDKLRRMEGLVHLDSLSGTGVENTIYEYDNNLYIWVENPEWGRWIGNYNSRPAGNHNEGGTFLCYDYLGLGDGDLIGKLGYGGYGSDKYLFYKDNIFVTYGSSTPDFTETPLDTIQPNTNVTINNVGIGNMIIYWDNTKKFIRITADYNGISEVVTPTISGSGWQAIHKNVTYKFATDAVINGIPRWTNEGKIVGREAGYYTKNIMYNTTGYSQNTTYITTGANGGPSRMFVPTQAGTSGQLLLSSGGGEPTWTNWIKSVQITSDAYDALVQAGTTDPNTLYLIVDE